MMNSDANGPMTCSEKVGKYKWWIIGGILALVIAVILALTLNGKAPAPPGPIPPTPPAYYNPYIVDVPSVKYSSGLMTGNLVIDQS